MLDFVQMIFYIQQPDWVDGVNSFASDYTLLFGLIFTGILIYLLFTLPKKMNNESKKSKTLNKDILICKSCSSKIESEDIFCGSCGEKLK